ncbi:Six-hairpin glycosidase [Hanseniaspora valbyensis NRRL Y-1626]|uniref:Six-hairpin glycosidase n=1 Tax=Hanseniaspora valbyensis NRRL Y-1626 TaxID=766949 RepID=A0A1B7T7L7_9ASCO|nr:Six-hairpin glycosidase [Hanseniaspora valbyensis NRRL Y-1626]
MTAQKEITLCCEPAASTINITLTELINDYISLDGSVSPPPPNIPMIKESLSWNLTDALKKYLTENLQFKKIETLTKELLDFHYDIDDWILGELEVCESKILSNVIDNNFNILKLNYFHIKEGSILASPSTENPNYFYDWVRDSGILMKTILNFVKVQLEFIDYDVEHDYVLKHVSFKNYKLFAFCLKNFNHNYVLMQQDNLSGSCDPNGDLKGLGEPKWNLDETRYDDPWGRPQNDGPAIRAMAALHFLQLLRKYKIKVKDIISAVKDLGLLKYEIFFENETEFINKYIYYDLKFIMLNWREENFDLWEEVKGFHFFTSLVQLKAIKLAQENLPFYQASDSGVLDDAFINKLEETYNNILNFMENDAGFTEADKCHYIENPQSKSHRCGLDIATIIGSNLTHDYLFEHDLGNAEIPYSSRDFKILNNLHHLGKKFVDLYPINDEFKKSELSIGCCMGRYPEDVYNGNGTSHGNPWFLAVSNSCLLVYNTIQDYLINKRDLEILLTSSVESDNFWNSIFALSNLHIPFEEDVKVTIPYGSDLWEMTLKALARFADLYILQVRMHLNQKLGSMSEQFDLNTGMMRGAEDLSWSYSSFWTAGIMRAKTLNELSKFEESRKKPSGFI